MLRGDGCSLELGNVDKSLRGGLELSGMLGAPPLPPPGFWSPSSSLRRVLHQRQAKECQAPGQTRSPAQMYIQGEANTPKQTGGRSVV